jgi:hypothetical protein
MALADKVAQLDALVVYGPRHGRIQREELAVFALLAAASPVHATPFSTRIINPSGGNTADDGLRLYVFGVGSFQIWHEGSGQVYSPDGIFPDEVGGGIALAMDSYVYGPWYLGDEVWRTMSQSEVLGTGTRFDPWRVDTVMSGPGHGVTVAYTVRYTYPDPYANIQVTVTPHRGTPTSSRSTMRSIAT